MTIEINKFFGNRQWFSRYIISLSSGNKKSFHSFSYKFSVDFDDLTIEHIHPQLNVGDKWTEENIGRLGNLIFLDQKMNGKLGIKDFSEKMKMLEDNDYNIPAFLKNKTEWTPSDVNNHTDEMSLTAYNKIWDI